MKDYNTKAFAEWATSELKKDPAFAKLQKEQPAFTSHEAGEAMGYLIMGCERLGVSVGRTLDVIVSAMKNAHGIEVLKRNGGRVEAEPGTSKIISKLPILPPLPPSDDPDDMEKLKRLANIVHGLTEDECDDEILHRLADALKEASIVGSTWGPWDLPLVEEEKS